MSINTSAQDPIVWIDCEMTGLDLEKDALIEVAVVVTDSELTPLDPGIDLVIRPTPGSVEQMVDVVRTMHTSSGLLDELDAGLDLAEAQRQVVEYVRRFVPEPRKAPLAGNSVGTDRTFLARDMPELVDHLHYRIIDVSSIKELARRWYPRAYFQAPAKAGGHRALADILESIDELRYYRTVLFPAGEGPDSAVARKAAAAVAATPTSLHVARLAQQAAERAERAQRAADHQAADQQASVAAQPAETVAAQPTDAAPGEQAGPLGA